METLVKRSKEIDEQFSDVTTEFKTLVHISVFESLIANRPVVDIIKTDEALEKADPEYNRTERTYKGQSISMKDYVRQKYGDRSMEFVEALINGLLEGD